MNEVLKKIDTKDLLKLLADIEVIRESANEAVGIFWVKVGATIRTELDNRLEEGWDN